MSTTAERLRRTPAWLCVPVVVALVLRVVLVVAQLELELFQIGYDAADSALYRDLADELRNHLRFGVDGEPTAYVTPGYPVFLAVIGLVSTSTLWIALVQCVLGAATVGFVADVARRLGGTRAAWLAGLGTAAYPHLLFWTGYVLTETLFVFGLAASVWLLVRAVERPEPRWAGLAGAAFAATGMVRPMVLLFAGAVIAGGLLVRAWRRAALVAGVAFLLLWAPWIVRNAVTMDAFVPTSTETGYVLWQGNSPGATGGSRGYVDQADFDPLPPPDEPLSEAESDRRYGREAMRWMVEHPGEVLELVPKKLANMFRPTYADASTLNTLVTLATYPLLLLLGLAGLPRLWRSGLAGRLLVALLAYLLAIHALVTGLIRFRLPLELLLLVAAGLAGAALLDRLRPQEAR